MDTMTNGKRAREQEGNRMLVEERILKHDLTLPEMILKAGTELTTYEQEDGQFVVMHFTGWWDVDKMYFEDSPL